MRQDLVDDNDALAERLTELERLSTVLREWVEEIVEPERVDEIEAIECQMPVNGSGLMRLEIKMGDDKGNTAIIFHDDSVQARRAYDQSDFEGRPPSVLLAEVSAASNGRFAAEKRNHMQKGKDHGYGYATSSICNGGGISAVAGR